MTMIGKASETRLLSPLSRWHVCGMAFLIMADTHAFVPSTNPHRHSIMLDSGKDSSNESSKSSDSSNGDDDENDELLDELRNTKKDLFGTDIPITDELKDAAQNAENAFLAAMLEQKQQFQQIKSEEGSDKAVDIFMGRIQKEDEASKLEDERLLESLMKEEEIVGEIDDENEKTSWQ